MEGGRFDFTDGGSYVGEWCEGRAHGLGIATGPENQGEYSGEWNMGFQSQGVYIWPNGKIYSGTWLKGKLHGEGVQVKGRWIYRGAFTTGFCGRYGVRESLTSCAKYEGSWHLNQFDGFGVETNSDGSIYAGAWSKGMRQGLGVRRSAPYEQAAEFSRTVRPAQSQNSIPSGTDSERGWRGTGSIGGTSTAGGDSRNDRGRPDERRSGFVLRSYSCPSQTSQVNSSRSSSGNRSGTSNQEKRSLFQRGIFRKLRKQKSTGDLSLIGGHAMSDFSTNSGCGGGSLFHGRGRRAGGSLRSTLSGSSQLTTTSFSRNDRKGIVNGGHGLTELFEEPLGPNVTETYSGQWIEDRRSGYGVAERSDGLRYVGEWFNNKKDGYGVTYKLDGTKEEGRYKENILVQLLNRRSKLFLIRHTKIRDAIEEAVRNAEEAAKKANENSAASAYQRAQTAQMVANTADAKAREARRLSDESRRIARDFSPDFLQPGIEWEKQNPLLKNTFLGQNSIELSSSPLSPDRQLQRIDDGTAGGHSLEVSGGSRQGSFRSSFRRKKQAPASSDPTSRLNPQTQYNYHQPKEQRSYAQHQTEDEYIKQANELENTRHNPDTDTSRLPQKRQPYESYSPPVQRSQAGRPMARAATTGVTGVIPPGADQRQIAHHMAQHPHSPYLMSSTSQQLDELDARPNEASFSGSSRGRNGGTDHGRPGNRAQQQRMTVVKGQLSTPAEHRASEMKLATSQLISPSEMHQARVDRIEDIRRPESTERSPGRTRNYKEQKMPSKQQRIPQDQQVNIDHYRRQAATLPRNDDIVNGLFETGVAKSNTLEPTHENQSKVGAYGPSQPLQPRRRTLPSIITDPLLTSRNSTDARLKAQKLTSAYPRNKLPRGVLEEASRATNESDVHSVENLTPLSVSSYIIENGIRKRVEALQQECYSDKLGVHHSRSETPQGVFTEGRRPEWTRAYDPYRPAMESTGIVPTDGHPYGCQEHTYEPAELGSLPRTYRIESTLSLWNTARAKEASAPDLPAACSFGEIGSGQWRRHYPRGWPTNSLTREEIEQLTNARKLELLAEMERRKKGEIVIRLADIKDWLRANFVVVFVIMVNASLAFLFFTLMTGSPILPAPDAPTSQQRRGAATPSRPISSAGQTAAKIAKKVIRTTLKSSNPMEQQSGGTP